MNEIEILSAELIDGELHIVKREKSNEMFMCYPPRPAPDRVWKEIYEAYFPEPEGMQYMGDEPGEPIRLKIQLQETIKGQHYPAKKVKERIVFDE